MHGLFTETEKEQAGNDVTQANWGTDKKNAFEKVTFFHYKTPKMISKKALSRTHKYTHSCWSYTTAIDTKMRGLLDPSSVRNN